MENFYSSDSLAMYLNEIGNYDLLSIEEEISLLKRIDKGDQKAKNKLLESNLKLVVSIAKKYSIKGMTLLDLIQEGNIGLIKAIEKFDINKNCRFATYAKYWITHSINRFINNKANEIRISVYMCEQITKFLRAQQQLQIELNREPTDEEISNRLNISLKKLEEIKMLEKLNCKSLNENITSSADDVIEDCIGKEEIGYNDIELEFDLERLLIFLKNVLSPLKYYVFYQRIILEKSRKEIAKLLDVSYAIVKSNEIRTLEFVQKNIKDNPFCQNKIQNILEQYKNKGIAINMIRLEPISLNNILKYLYIKDILTENERKLLRFKFFSELKYSKENALKELNFTLEEFEITKNSLNAKIKNKFVDRDDFYNFAKTILRTYGSILLFDLDLIDGIDTINNKKQKYEELLALINNLDITVSPEKSELLKDYFDSENEIYNNTDNQKEIKAYNLLKDKYPEFLELKLLTRDDIIDLLRNNANVIDEDTKYSLMKLFGICKRDIMDSKDLKKVLRMINHTNVLRK